MSSNTPRTLYTFYRPPRHQILPLSDIQNVLDLILPTIILADANLHHRAFGHNKSNRLGKILNNFINDLTTGGCLDCLENNCHKLRMAFFDATQRFNYYIQFFYFLYYKVVFELGFL